MKNITDLFTQFFQSIGHNQKAKEVQRIYQNHLCNKFSLLCLLFNWLIDITRKKFATFVKTQAEYVQRMLAQDSAIKSNKAKDAHTPSSILLDDNIHGGVIINHDLHTHLQTPSNDAG